MLTLSVPNLYRVSDILKRNIRPVAMLGLLSANGIGATEVQYNH